MNHRTKMLAATLISMCGLAASAFGQATLDAPQGFDLPRVVDSGSHANPAAVERVVFSDVVVTPGAAWTRLYFSEIVLAPGSYVRFTSMTDGEVQTLDDAGVRMWNYTSAYFNGDRVIIELIAAPGSKHNRIVLDHIAVEMKKNGGQGERGSCGICGPDDRVPSNFAFAGRLMPVGCSGTLYTEDSCIVTAGHCAGGSSVIQFNVPASTPGCDTVNPPIADQFPITQHLSANGGVGNDWSVMTSGLNSLGQTAVERQGGFRPIAPDLAPLGGSIQVWGYGVDQECVRTQIQQFSDGSVSNITSLYYDIQMDITFGNSGSSVFHEDEIVGIVTHCRGGCPNIATRIDHPAFTASRQILCGDNPGPDNDYCIRARPVTFGENLFTTALANTDGPAHPQCASGDDGQLNADAWFYFTTDCDGELTVSTCDGTDFDTKIAVYLGNSCIELGTRLIACNDDACGSGSSVTFTGQRGRSYLVRVGGNDGAEGTGVLSITRGDCTQPPANNGCGAPIIVGLGDTLFTNVHATADGPSHIDCDVPESTRIESDVWFQYTAECDKPLTITTCAGADFDTGIAVYTGTGCLQIQNRFVACNDNACGTGSSVTFTPTVGTVYKIRVGGINGAEGSGVLTLTCGGADCPADWDANGIVNSADVGAFLTTYFQNLTKGGLEADVDGNGVVNSADVGLFLTTYFSSVGPCP